MAVTDPELFSPVQQIVPIAPSGGRPTTVVILRLSKGTAIGPWGGVNLPFRWAIIPAWRSPLWRSSCHFEGLAGAASVMLNRRWSS